MEQNGPLKLENEGRLQEAAEAYAVEGFQKLFESHFEVGHLSRVGIGYLLQAISCDCRIDNKNRAGVVYDIITPLLHKMKNSAQESVLQGLALEWLGDGALMLGHNDTVVLYQSAIDYYDELAWEDKTWQDEPEFMHAYWAIEAFSRAHGFELSAPDFSTSFEDRVVEKIELYNSLGQ